MYQAIEKCGNCVLDALKIDYVSSTNIFGIGERLTVSNQRTRSRWKYIAQAWDVIHCKYAATWNIFRSLR